MFIFSPYNFTYNLYIYLFVQGGTLVAKTFGIPLDDLVARDCHESGVPIVVHKMCQYILDNG